MNLHAFLRETSELVVLGQLASYENVEGSIQSDIQSREVAKCILELALWNPGCRDDELVSEPCGSRQPCENTFDVRSQCFRPRKKSCGKSPEPRFVQAREWR